jgi:Zn-dependent M28 family amino/carboxypeptidase
VIYSAHWDHLGKNEKLKGDQIYNGALDNASGTAGLLEIAKAYSRLHTAPRRTILFLSTTAEEKGLLGAEYYAENPFYPLSRTLADINMDCLNPWGRTRDLIVIGSGSATLDDVVSRIAGSQGRRVVPDLEPGKGFFYRSDQFKFAGRGVPTLYTDGGVDLIGKTVA